MSSLLIRVLLFAALLGISFQFGWEYAMAVIILFIVLGLNYWEFIFIGLVLDLTLKFPTAFFSGMISFILLYSLVSENFFKSETYSNLLAKALIISLLIFTLAFIFYGVFLGGELFLAFKLAFSSYLKVFLPLPVFILLARIIESKHGKKTLLE